MKDYEIAYLTYLMCYSPESLSGIQKKKVNQHTYWYCQKENLYIVPVSDFSSFLFDVSSEISQRIISTASSSFPQIFETRLQVDLQSFVGVEIVKTITHSDLRAWLDYLVQYTFLPSEEIQNISSQIEYIHENYHLARTSFRL